MYLTSGTGFYGYQLTRLNSRKTHKKLKSQAVKKMLDNAKQLQVAFSLRPYRICYIYRRMRSYFFSNVRSIFYLISPLT